VSLTKHLRIEVTQADIDAGVRHASYKCMMALAVKRATGLVAMVTTRFVAIDEPMGGAAIKRVWYELNDTTIKRVSDFDDGLPVKPFVTYIHGI